MYTKQTFMVKTLGKQIHDLIADTNWNQSMPDRDFVISLIEVKGELIRAERKLIRIVSKLRELEIPLTEKAEYDNQINQID